MKRIGIAFFLTLLAASGLLAQTPAPGDRRTLVVVDLAGGSDGLNTVIPYTDPAYLSVRSNAFVDPKTAVPLNDALGLHPALAPLVEPWKAGDLAVVLGVGYTNPNRSHFRSIAIWETASDADTVLTTGWLARLVKALPADPARFADSVIIGEGTSGPLGGPWMHNLTLSSLDGFLRDANDLGLLDAPAPTQAEKDGGVCVTTGPQYEVATVGGDISRWAKALQALKPKLPDFDAVFPKTPFGRQAELAAQLLAAGVDVPVIKLTLRGYDTHVDEARAQAALHKDFAETMVAFRKALTQVGRWKSTAVMTYSEFGRRVEGNGSGGTDHGTAAPLFVLGGTVNGGQFVGTQPSLADLTSGDLKFSVDFHEVYATLVKKFWGLTDAKVVADISGGQAGELPLFKN